MSEPLPVLVVTQPDDVTADIVVTELNRRDMQVVRFDPAEFPYSLAFSAAIDGDGLLGRLTTATRRAELDAVRSLYYRRPSGFAFPGLNEQEAHFATLQARFGFGGVLASLPRCLYVNHPHAVADAEFKPAQLTAAADLGFIVPRTLITNDPDRARAFAAAYGPIVYKPLRASPYHRDGRARTVWVAEVDPDELDESIAGTAHLFHLTEPIAAYLKRFDLVFGCFDIALRPDGTPVFLECNPNGQWAWLEDETGLPVTAALADLLERGNT